MANNLLLAAIPLFFLLILIELIVDYRRGTGFIRYNDAFSSLALGTWSLSTKLLIVGVGAWFYQDVLNGWQLFENYKMGPVSWVVLFIAYDFCYYWLHRAGHEINFFWAAHSIHHQSEEYNLTTALRQTSSGIFGFIFYFPLYLWGVPVEAIATVGALNLIYQYWVHTRHIGDLGWYEWFFVTPSNHRVHHGQNPEYIDKNHGGVFIIWDRLFGTFQTELPNVKTIYGVRRSLNSFSPFAANIQVWWSLLSDAIHAASWRDKLRIWVMPTGWRPADQELTRPITKTDLQNFEPYNPATLKGLKWYSMFQLTLSMVLGTWFTATFVDANYAVLFSMWLVVSLPLITSARLLQQAPRAWLSEALRQPATLVAVAMIYQYGNESIIALVWVLVSSLWLAILSIQQSKGAHDERSDQSVV